MAILHGTATIRPSKLEMLSAHLAGIPALAPPLGAELTAIAAYRFDDPAGVVGIETHLLTSGSGPVIHIPLTYRPGPLDGAEDSLLGTMEHSVLGRRWVYDGCGDPVYVAELARTILTGGSQVELIAETDEGRVVRKPSAVVAGSGSAGAAVPAIDRIRRSFDGVNTTIEASGLELVVRHVLDGPTPTPQHATLAGTWLGVDEPVVLAYIR